MLSANNQQSVLQCLYVQCQTSQYALALHHALSRCSDYGSDTLQSTPPLLHNQRLRKRVTPINALQSNLAMASARFSAPPRPFPSGIEPTRARPTRTTVAIAATIPTSNASASAFLTLPAFNSSGFTRFLNNSVTATSLFPTTRISNEPVINTTATSRA